MPWYDAFKRMVVEGYSGDGVPRDLFLGKGGSLHSRDAAGKSIPSAQGAMMVDPSLVLGVANVALSVVNVGLGIYNAYQTTKISKQVILLTEHLGVGVRSIRDDISGVHETLVAGLDSVQSLLREQQRVLLEGLEGLETRLREEVRTVTRERRLDEYLDRAMHLELLKREFVDRLTQQGRVPPREMEKVTEASEKLEAWLRSQLAQTELPAWARQPLVLGIAESTVARVDMLMFEDPDANREFAVSKLDGLREMVSDEIRLLHRGTSPWGVATTLRDQVALYAMLNRALAASARAVRERPESQGDVEIAMWDDHIPTRAVATTSGDLPVEGEMQTALPLKTLDDYVWLIRAFGLDRETLDVHSVPAVSREVMEARLGTHGGRAALPVLRQFLEPAIWQAYRGAVESEFGIPVSVNLAPVSPGLLEPPAPALPPTPAPSAPEPAPHQEVVDPHLHAVGTMDDLLVASQSYPVLLLADSADAGSGEKYLRKILREEVLPGILTSPLARGVRFYFVNVSGWFSVKSDLAEVLDSQGRRRKGCSVYFDGKLVSEAFIDGWGASSEELVAAALKALHEFSLRRG